jgi:hypothetical protein
LIAKALDFGGYLGKTSVRIIALVFEEGIVNYLCMGFRRTICRFARFVLRITPAICGALSLPDCAAA